MKSLSIVVGIALYAAVFTVSCEHHKTDGHHESAALPEMNNGRKWTADEPTRRGFAKLRSEVSAPVTTSDSIAAYNARAEKVTSDINAVFAGCRMTGPGHVELHKYIALLLQDLEPMRGKDVRAAQDAQKKLAEDLELFAKYFE